MNANKLNLINCNLIIPGLLCKGDEVISCHAYIHIRLLELGGGGGRDILQAPRFRLTSSSGSLEDCYIISVCLLTASMVRTSRSKTIYKLISHLFTKNR